MGDEYYREAPEEIYLNPIYGRSLYDPVVEEQLEEARLQEEQKNRAKKKHEQEAYDDAGNFPVNEEIEKGAKRQGAKKAVRLAVLVILILLAAAALFGIFVCKTEAVSFEGNVIYTDEELKAFTDKLRFADHTIPVWLHYNRNYRKEIPFVRQTEAVFDSPKRLIVSVTEERPSAYVQYGDYRLYLDRTGLVVASSDRVVPGVPALNGMEVDEASVGDLLPVKDPVLLETVCGASDSLRSGGYGVSAISVDEKGDITLVSDRIELRFGQAQNMEEKATLALVLLEKLSGRAGILHLEDYDGTNGNRNFEEK